VARTLLDMGRIYKSLGLADRAQRKLDEALEECRKVARTRAADDPKLLEQCQFLTWKIYFEKGDLRAAVAVCMRLIKQFPESEYVDDALMTMARSEMENGNYARAISVFRSLLQVKGSVFRPDAQFHIAECYAKMSLGRPGPDGKPIINRAYQDRALQEYQNTVNLFPDSPYAAQAVVKTAEYYYENRQYERAIEVFERALAEYPDSRHVPTILLSYGKCLVRMRRFADAMARFQAVVTSYPESEHAEDARKLLQATRRAVAASAPTREGSGFE